MGFSTEDDGYPSTPLKNGSTIPQTTVVALTGCQLGPREYVIRGAPGKPGAIGGSVRPVVRFLIGPKGIHHLGAFKPLYGRPVGFSYYMVFWPNP